MRAGAVLLALLAACAGSALSPRTLSVRPSSDPALVIGTFRLAPNGVVDGDTFKVEGLKRSLRILAIDTEEQPRPDRMAAERYRLMQSDFAAYAAREAAGRPLPVKYPTPLGAEATAWAARALGPGATLRLERDQPGQDADAFGRTLCHVWVVPADGGEPWHYGLEAIRRGFSPYFTKYGRSRRFDAELAAAQAAAREKQVGIWARGAPHYPDYEVRLAWWARRADGLEAVERMDPPPVRLGDRDAIRTLSARVGQRVTVFGLVDDHDADAILGRTVRIGGRWHIELELAGDLGIDPERWRGELLVVSGRLDRQGSVLRGKLRYMRIPVSDPSQVRLAHEASGKSR